MHINNDKVNITITEEALKTIKQNDSLVTIDAIDGNKLIIDIGGIDRDLLEALADSVSKIGKDKTIDNLNFFALEINEMKAKRQRQGNWFFSKVLSRLRRINRKPDREKIYGPVYMKVNIPTRDKMLNLSKINNPDIDTKEWEDIVDDM